LFTQLVSKGGAENAGPENAGLENVGLENRPRLKSDELRLKQMIIDQTYM